MARLLGRIRLSRMTEESTSVERQRVAIEAYAQSNGHEIVGWAIDTDVSGSVSPFDAPELGPWLTPEGMSGWDVLCAWKLDRIARRIIPLHRLLEVCEDNGKSIVSTGESFDLSTWTGQMLVSIIAGVAQGELEAITARNQSAYDHNIRAGKYRGGNPPFGYRPIKVKDTCWPCAVADQTCGHIGEWRYEPDPEMKELVRSIATRLLDGEPISRVVRTLNDAGTLTPLDHFRVSQGNEPKGARWATSNLTRELQSQTLLGYVMASETKTDENGKVIKRNGRKLYGPKRPLLVDGRPVVRAEPILTQSEFNRLQSVLDQRKQTGRRGVAPKPSGALLLRVLHCGVCERPFYKFQTKGRKARYRCSAAVYQSTCGNGTILMEVADSIVTENLLDTLGALPHMVKVFDPGSDVSQELDQVNDELNSLAEAVTRFPTGPALDKLLANVDALAARKAELESKPKRKSGYHWEPSGQTFAEYWASIDNEQRNTYLRDHNVTLTYSKVENKGPEWHLTFGQLDTMVSAINPEKAAQLKPGMSWTEQAKVLSADA